MSAQSRDAYAFNTNGGVIVSPGKFEGQPAWLPPFWEAVLDGFCDGEYEEPDGTMVAVFELDDQDKQRFPIMAKSHELEVWEDGQGFVRYKLS